MLTGPGKLKKKWTCNDLTPIKKGPHNEVPALTSIFFLNDYTTYVLHL